MRYMNGILFLLPRMMSPTVMSIILKTIVVSASATYYRTDHLKTPCKKEKKRDLDRIDIITSFFVDLMKMASMQLARATLFSLSKAFPIVRSPLTLAASSTRKVSRVCFASSVSHSEGRDPVENARDSRADVPYGSKKWRENTEENYAQGAKDKANEGASKAADKAYETKEQAKGTAYEAKEKAKDYAELTKDKVNEGAYKAADKAEDTKERAKEKAEDTMDSAKAKARDAKEKVKEYGEETKEKAEGFKETVKGKAEELGEKTKETVKGAWENTKDSARTVTEAVVGPEEDADEARADIDKGVEDLTKKAEKKDEKDRKEDEFITFN
ncbi:hypothetical protein YC2023_095239 [Brassica napus]